MGLSLAVAAAGTGSASTLRVQPARSARASETATTAYALGPAPSLGTDELIAYAPDDSYTYVAWNAPDGKGIDLCVLEPNTTSCEGGGPLELTDTAYLTGDGTPVLAGLTVLPSGEVVVLAASAGGTGGYQNGGGTYAWASPEGGAAFLSGNDGLQNSGKPISPVSLYYTEGNALPLSGSDLALFDDYTPAGNYFSDSPYSGPETPVTIDEPNANPSGSYPRKPYFGAGPSFGVEPTPGVSGKETVVAVGDDYSFGSDLPACGDTDNGTGYDVQVGTVGGIASGSLNSEGLPNFTGLTCYAVGPVVASGGGAGIGVLQQEGFGSSSDLTLDWRPFNATSTGGSFGNAVQLEDLQSHVLDEATNLDASEDTGDGVYVSWSQEGGIVLDYSPNGGATWSGPIVQNELSDGSKQGDPVIAGVGGGVGEIAYDNNLGSGNEVYIQTVDFEPPAPTSLTTSQTAGTATGANLTIDAGTVGESDQATLTGSNVSLASIGYVGGAFPGGTVTYSLYSNSACTDKGKVYPEGTVTVTAGSVPASSAITSVLAPGTYYWQASFAGNLANAPSTSACGGEKLTVAPIQAVGSATTSGAGTAIAIKCFAACKGVAALESGRPASGQGETRGHTAPGKPRVIGRASFSLTKAGKAHVDITFNAYGQKLLKKDHDKLAATLLLKLRSKGKTYTTASALKLRK